MFSWLSAALLGLLTLPAADTPSPTGISASPDGMIIRRAAIGQPWHPVKKGDALPAGHLLLALPGASIISADDGVLLKAVGNLDGDSPLPIIETGFSLHSADKEDLDVTLDRGRIDLINHKEKGEARARVRFRGKIWDLTLRTPGSRVVVEMFSRWGCGTKFHPESKEHAEPVTEVLLIVAEGKAELESEGRHYGLTAPPGPAIVHWDNVTDHDSLPSRIDVLPDWAKPVVHTAEGQKDRAKIDLFRKLILDKGPRAAIQELLDSGDPDMRRRAFYALGATDDLDGMADALKNAKGGDVWDHAVVALRHWLGRNADQPRRLYNRLVEQGHFSKIEAETVLSLLHDFSDDELTHPETYEALIDYLEHDKLTIRGLANWHLYRLVPAGRAITYNPTGTAEEHAAAAKAWRKLIPAGKLPTKVVPEKPA